MILSERITAALFQTSMIMFNRQTVFVLGGGPSLSDVDLSKLHSRRIIAINDAGYVSPWNDVLFFRDLKWFHSNRALVSDWQGYVFTTNVKSREECSKIKYIEMKHMNEFSFLSLRYGRSSGHIAVSLAITLGARRVVLLGFDCRIVNGRTHFHDNAFPQADVLYSKDFLPAWNGWGLGAAQMGVEILNATPESAIKEFPFRSLDEIFST